MKKLIKKAMSLTFAATVAFCSLNNTSALPETSGESGIGGVAAENSNYILQYNEETAGITVISKNSGCKSGDTRRRFRNNGGQNEKSAYT